MLSTEAGLWEAVHTLFDFYVDPAVVGDFLCKVVVGDDIFWEVAEFEVHILAPSHKGVQIGVFYINRHEFCIGRGYDAVE